MCSSHVHTHSWSSPVLLKYIQSRAFLRQSRDPPPHSFQWFRVNFKFLPPPRATAAAGTSCRSSSAASQHHQSRRTTLRREPFAKHPQPLTSAEQRCRRPPLPARAATTPPRASRAPPAPYHRTSRPRRTEPAHGSQSQSRRPATTASAATHLRWAALPQATAPFASGSDPCSIQPAGAGSPGHRATTSCVAFPPRQSLAPPQAPTAPRRAGGSVASDAPTSLPQLLTGA